jgi:pimeloyl-ACP methyl ester carboxylesterase
VPWAVQVGRTGIERGVSVWSAIDGDGDDLFVLVHGSLDRSAGMLKLSRRLARRSTVMRYDRRGYGRSTPHEGPFTMDGQVDDLLELIDGAPSHDRCIVVGHSYGGNVALTAVDRHPGMIDAVVTYESPLSWLPWWEGSAGAHAMEASDPEEAAERFMRRLVGDDRWERLPATTRGARRSEGIAMLGELGDLRMGAPWRPERITVPVLVMYGEHGQSHHRRGAETLGRLLPDATVEMIPGARHFGPNTHPDEVAARVVDFVDTCLSGR